MRRRFSFAAVLANFGKRPAFADRRLSQDWHAVSFCVAIELNAARI